jgi:putative phage-type endonuclease
MSLTEHDLAGITAATVVADLREITREQWLDLRRQGIGGSDAAAVVGISKWTAAYSLWLDKTGRSTESEDSTRFRAGHFLEPFIAAEASRKHIDDGLILDECPFMLRHPDHDELFVDVDGLAWMKTRTRRGGSEYKTVSEFAASDWADGVPGYYEAQAFHSMAVTGLDWWLVAPMIGFGRVDTFIIERDDEIIEALVAREREWWQRHVVEDVEPTVDSSKAATEALALIEARAGAVRVAEPDELEDLFRQLAHDKAVADEVTDSMALAKNTLRQMLGEATELEGPDGRRWATWRRAKGKTVTDWQAAARAASFALGVPLDELLAPHTTTAPGVRSLRIDAGIKNVTKEN